MPFYYPRQPFNRFTKTKKENEQKEQKEGTYPHYKKQQEG